MHRGHRDLNARATAVRVTLPESHTKTKSEPQNNSFSSSSTVSSTRIPSSWNDDTSTAPTMSEGWQLLEQDSTSKTLQPYKPGIAKETQALSSLESSVDTDFSTIPSAWNDDDIAVSDGMTKGNEDQDANENGKLTHPVSNSSISPKKDMTVSISSLAISKSDVRLVTVTAHLPILLLKALLLLLTANLVMQSVRKYWRIIEPGMLALRIYLVMQSVTKYWRIIEPGMLALRIYLFRCLQ